MTERKYWPAMRPEVVAAASLRGSYIVTAEIHWSGGLVWNGWKNGERVRAFTRSECHRFPKFLAKAGTELFEAVNGGPYVRA